MSKSRTVDRDKGSGVGATVSALLHGTLIALTVIAWPKLVPPIEFEPDVLPVELLPISDETNIAPQTKAEEPPPEPVVQPPPPEPPVPTTMAEAPPPPPEDVEGDTPALVPPETKPTPPPPAHVPPSVRPRVKPKPEKAREQFDINRISGLVDKLAKDTPKPAPEKPAEPAPAASSRTMAGVGAQTGLTVSEIDSMKQQVGKCWNVQTGAPDPSALIFRVRITLNPDGSVSGVPQLLDTLGMNDPYYRAAAESAIRAVNMCAPYKLPAEKYEKWHEIDLKFDPREMSGY